MTTRFVPPIPVLPAGYSSYNKYTAGVFHAYADSSRPDDTGDGLSWLTAKKTLEAAFSILPEVSKSHIVVNVKGSHDFATFTSKFQYPGPNILHSDTGAAGNFIIDGGDAVIEVVSTSTATSSTTTSITDTTKSWVTDELFGYSIEILTGASAGYIYTIQSNTADTIVVGKTWPAPGLCQYRVIKPETILYCSSGTAVIYFSGKVSGRLSFQRLRIGQNLYIGTLAGISGFSYIQIGDVIFETNANGSPALHAGLGHILSYRKYDVSNPSSYMSSTKDKRSFAHCRSDGGYAVYVNATGTVAIQDLCTIKSLVHVQASDKVTVSAGARIGNFYFRSVNMASIGSGTTLPVLIGTASVSLGVEVVRSGIIVAGPVDVSNCASHAIQLDNSVLECQSAILSGSGNGGAGVYLKNRSSVIFKEGYTPTLTGTAGDIAVTSETVADATWAQVAAGDPVEIMPDGSVKEVP